MAEDIADHRADPEMTCPQCRAAMGAHAVGGITVLRCEGCSGIFLERADLAHLVEAENDYHRDSGPATQPIPRIMPGMSSPPPLAQSSRAYIQLLFG